MSSKRVAIACVVALALGANIAPSLARTMRIVNVPNLPDVECGTSSSGAGVQCTADAAKWEVKVLPITNEGGVVLGCLATFLYNNLNVRTGRSEEHTSELQSL